MTARIPAGRSSRFYTENVQYNDRTYKKLKCFLLHLRHLLPAADCGKGKEGLTALCNSVRNDYSIYRQTKSMNRLFRRFLFYPGTPDTRFQLFVKISDFPYANAGFFVILYIDWRRTVPSVR